MITRKPDGTLQFDTVVEAIEYERASKSLTISVKAPVRIVNPEVAAAASEIDPLADWKQIRSAMRPYQDKVIGSAEMMKILGVSGITGVGVKLRHLANRLSLNGIKIDDYFVKQPSNDGAPLWKVDVSGGLV